MSRAIWGFDARSCRALSCAAAGLALIGSCALSSAAGVAAGLVEQGTEAFYRGDLAGAEKFAKRYSALNPKRTEGWVLLARTQMAEGAQNAAFQSLREALKRDPQNIDTLYFLGLVSAALAGTEFQALMTMAPDSTRAHQFLAESYVGEGNTSKAVEEYQAALAIEPRSVEILLALADVERSRSRYDEALAYYLRALEIEPKNYTTIYQTGLVYLRRGEPRNAISYFRRATSMEPNAAVPHLALGMALFRSGDVEGAIPELRAATTLDSKLRQAFTYLAQAYSVTGRRREGQEAMQKANDLAAAESKADEGRLGLVAPPSDLPAQPPGAHGRGPK